MTRNVPSSRRSIRSAFPRSRTAPWTVWRAELERAFEFVLEQPFHHRHVVLDLEVEGAFTEPGPNRRAEKIRSFECAIGFGQTCQDRLGDGPEQFECVSQVCRRNRSAAGVVPPLEEHLKDFVQQLTSFLRAQTRLVVSLLVETKHAGCEILERALDIPFDMADGVGLGRAGAGGAMKCIVFRRGTTGAERKPRCRFAIGGERDPASRR